MTKYLNGAELAGYIKERQAKTVRMLKQAHGIVPSLAVVICGEDEASQKYVTFKKRYGEDIGIGVDLIQVGASELEATIKNLAGDDGYQGIIVQLPLPTGVDSEHVLNLIPPAKDVDGLCLGSSFTPATPQAIIWLLNGYNVELLGKRIVVVGQGKLVGAPLTKLLLASGYQVTALDEQSSNWLEAVQSADVVITATGKPGLIKSEHLKQSAVLVDAGTSVEQGFNVETPMMMFTTGKT